MKTSIVSPVYNSGNIVSLFVQLVIENIKLISDDFEIVLVDDGSEDNSWEKIKQNAKKYPFIKALKLSRNFGQHYAITAGLDKAKGDWIIVMDSDLQDRPEEFSRLYKKALEGYDAVLAQRSERKDPLFKKLCSKSFYKVLSFLSGIKFDHSIANFGIYNKKVIRAVLTLKEKIRFFPTMVNWVGFKTTKISVMHRDRSIGKSSYSFRKLLKLSLDVILVNSDRPIKIIVFMGSVISMTSFLYGIYILILFFTNRIQVLGYTTIVSLYCFIAGVIIFTLGIIGLYIGKIFEGIKFRPIYLIDEEING